MTALTADLTFDRMHDATDDATIQGLWFTVYRNEDLLTCAFD